MKSYLMECILGPLFKLLEASFELLVPLVMASIIDQGIKQNDTGHIINSGLILVALSLIGLVCSITAQYFSAKAATGFAANVKHALFAHIQRLSFTETDTIGTSTMITRLTSDMNQIQNGVNLTLRLFLRSPFIVFGAMIMAFTINLKAALIFVIVIPILSVVVFGIMLVTMPLYKKVQRRLDQILGTTRENLTGIRVIRAFNKEEEEIDAFDQENDALTATQLFVGRISGLMNPVTYMIINAALLILIYTGGLEVDSDVITQGQVVALVNYMGQILTELIKLANLIINITKALACAGRVSAVLETPSSQSFPDTLPEKHTLTPGTHSADRYMNSSDTPSVASYMAVPDKCSKPSCADSPETVAGVSHISTAGIQTCADTNNMVVFDHVSLHYSQAGEESLTDISFSVKRGETVGIIGGTGSGKSSLVNLIPRFYDITAGKLFIEDINIFDYPMEQLRRKIGIVMQKAVLFQGTIRENLKWGNAQATDEEMWEALKLAQAADFVAATPNGLDHKIAQGGRNLSGGQRQRLTIARALIRQPEILILDDSASALDYATDARLRSAIRNMPTKPTTFIVSQRAASLMHADQIVVLDDGQVAGIGTHDELLTSCEVYREIYESQFDTKVQA